MLTSAYLIVSTVLLLAIFAVWSKRGLLNISIKMVFLAAGIMGVLVTLKQFGLIVQI